MVGNNLILIFRGIQFNLQAVKESFRKEFVLFILRAKKNMSDLMSSWIDTAL